VKASQSAALILAVMLGGCASNAERADLEAKRTQRVQAHTNLGVEYMTRNNLDVAQQELEVALNLDSDDSQANHYMGLLQIRLKNLDKAERYLRRAVSLKSDNADARNSLGVFLCEQGKFQEADEQFQAAIQNPLYQTPDQANTNAGICRLKSGDRRAAKAYFRAALQSNPAQPSALINMARLSLEDGEALAARGFMQRYLEAAGDNPAALLLAFRIERALGAKDAQAKYAVKLRDKYPNSEEAKELRSIAGYRQ
jgi:type IV pilus assembly protein PilF